MGRLLLATKPKGEKKELRSFKSEKGKENVIIHHPLRHTLRSKKKEFIQDSIQANQQNRERKEGKLSSLSPSNKKKRKKDGRSSLRSRIVDGPRGRKTKRSSRVSRSEKRGKGREIVGFLKMDRKAEFYHYLLSGRKKKQERKSTKKRIVHSPGGGSEKKGGSL